MHPAPSLLEAPPNRDERTSGPPQQQQPQQHNPTSPDGHDNQQDDPASPPVRKDTTSSTSTTATSASGATITSSETAGTAYSVESNYASQAVFSLKDGSDLNNRRTSRRRTGPLSAQQREKAALIRKLGACSDCRRRRVACHPSHHNMTWEDAVKKYKPDNHPDSLPPIAGRPLSPATLGPARLTHDPQEMDIDSTPTPSQPAGRLPLSDTRLRTPLPSGRSLEKLASAALPGIDYRTDLQSIASRIAANPYRHRYSAAYALLLFWKDDDIEVDEAVRDLARVLKDDYNYTFEIALIPPHADEDGTGTPFRWLSRHITKFVCDHDQRDVLKLVYYNGHSYLDGNREMVLSSSKDRGLTIRWSGVQQILEDARSDTLLLMDAAFYPSSTKMVRQLGVFELIAASASEDHIKMLSRNSFTNLITELLRTRAAQRFLSPFSAAELHATLLSSYPKVIQDRNPERVVTSSLAPLHIHMSGNTRLPSITLAPRRVASYSYDPDPTSPQLSLSFSLSDDNINVDSWAEWLRAMPDGVKFVRVEGPYRHTLR